MKKVRFEPSSQTLKIMDSECHSPRPFIQRHIQNPPVLNYDHPRVLPYNDDPVERFENSNSSPYPTIHKTNVPLYSERETEWKPSSELELSMLDSYEPRRPVFCKSILKTSDENSLANIQQPTNVYITKPKILSSIENTKIRNNDPPNILVKDNSFFIRKENLDKLHLNIEPLQNQMKRLCIEKENDPFSKKVEMKMATPQLVFDNMNNIMSPVSPPSFLDEERGCHQCIKAISPHNTQIQKLSMNSVGQNHQNVNPKCYCQCEIVQEPKSCAHCDHYIPPKHICRTCNCHNATPVKSNSNQIPLNGVDKKTWAIERYEQNKEECMEVEKQMNVSKEKRQPTVSDLFKIIKLQNEQLQLLQEKVDKFISVNNKPQNTIPVQSHAEVALKSAEEQHKISIGVMTSFEMVRTSTSTVINKEVVKQTNDNAQIQCNRSQISIKEVVSKPVANFLDGIPPVQQQNVENASNVPKNDTPQVENNNDKTFNELSLYNVHVDNAITPLMSPEQSLCLDIRDYSESEAGSDNHSHVGWTFYNQVMTHVNGILQHSDMPSSASAMYRNMHQQCVQMQITDKTNVSVTKRVKFGDDPLGIQQPHLYATTSTDTSLKMNQLAAKYLKNNGTTPSMSQRTVTKPAAPIEMSFATRDYMERHKILQGVPYPSRTQQHGEIPRFLDITALKQQPKLL